MKLNSSARSYLKSLGRDNFWKVLGFLGLSFIAGMIEITGIALIFPFVYLLVDPAAIKSHKAIADMMAVVHIQTNDELKIVLGGIVIGLILLKVIYMLFFRYLQLKTFSNMKINLTTRLMKMYLYASYQVHLIKDTSEIIRNILLSPIIVDQFIVPIINSLVSVVICLCLVSILVYVLPVGGLFALVGLTMLALILYKATGGAFEQLGEEYNDIYEKRQKVIVQSLTSIKETKVAGCEGFFLNKFLDLEKRNFANQQKNGFISSMPILAMESCIMIGILGLISFYLMHDERIYALTILGVLVACMFRMMPQVHKVLTSIQLIKGSISILNMVMSEFNQYEDKITLPDYMASCSFTKDIVLNNIDFSYDNKTEILKNISLRIKKNEFIGITGPSGSGKSTLVDIILGLLKPTAGELLIDGNVLDSEDKISAWQRLFGYVPQNTILHGGSLNDNIAFGIDKESQDKSRMQEVLRLVNLVEFIDFLDDREDALGENGKNLSGGQRQRIGIARALYKDSKLLILDEPTVSLDSKIEFNIIENLFKYKGTKTIFMIAHRLNTLKLCDKIIVMDKGRVAGFDTYENLAEHCTLFRELLIKSGQLQEKKADTAYSQV